MSNILLYIMVGIMSIVGGGATLFLIASLPTVLIWKIYRKVRFGYKMTD